MQGMELGAMVTVSKVETSEDLRHAKASITILPSDELTEKMVLAKIAESLYEIQGSINRKLAMKVVPRVAFVVDYSQAYVSRISKLLKQSHEDKDAV